MHYFIDFSCSYLATPNREAVSSSDHPCQPPAALLSSLNLLSRTEQRLSYRHNTYLHHKTMLCFVQPFFPLLTTSLGPYSSV